MTIEKILIATIITVFAWIHIAPQVVFFVRALERAEARCVTYELESKWSWWSLRFHDVYSHCLEYKDIHN